MESLDERWQAVIRRDSRYDGRFVYGVRSTGVYCRPVCAARRPSPENVVFFPDAAQAEQAGFRPCLRCRPNGIPRQERHLELVQRICRHLEDELEENPTLGDLAVRFGMSACHLQRTFRRIVGVTPRQYAQARRTERFKDRLKDGGKVTDALYEVGYGSSRAAYERSKERLGMTPGIYGRGGASLSISYTSVACPVGLLLVAATGQGVCAVKLGDSRARLEELLREEFPAAALHRDDAGLAPATEAILQLIDGARPHLDLPLDVKATAFQRRVWDALRAIPFGETRSYGDVARGLGRPRAARAVARACAANPVALLVPCHRVVQGDGREGGYRWGAERKRALLARERTPRITPDE